ncbi:MAG: hypothetical protein G01um101430_146 [Parcubacteria group bacterium Gr01-1014_30]|nr:MAG: hypothetical protein G01um101430_146 [Parcubacteria group bacterium Gr01-1014_30]
MGHKGFTLIELLVAVAVLSIIIGAIVGIFIAGVRQQSIALKVQTILDQTSFVAEFMSRALRLAQKELGQGCLSELGLNYEITRGGEGIKFINSLENQDCQEFFFDPNFRQVMYSRMGQELEITSIRNPVLSFSVNLTGESQDDNVQPRITFFLAVQGETAGVPRVRIQTTVSQRNLDARR